MKYKPAHLTAIVLILAGAWGLRGLEYYQNHHDTRWIPWVFFLTGAATAAGFTVFIGYSVVRQKTYIGKAPIPGQWIYRREDPVIYWAYLGMYLLFDGGLIYTLVRLLPEMRRLL